MRRINPLWVWVPGFCLLPLAGLMMRPAASLAAADAPSKTDKPVEAAKSDTPEADAKSTSLFDGKTLTGWQRSDFAGGGEPAVEDGLLILPNGEQLTGVTWTGKPMPKSNYEVSLEAKRVDGSDFFCGLTVPIKNSFVSLIVGGWGGTVVGISSLDGNDAANNNTTRTLRFIRGQWYPIRLRITDNRIRAWIDGNEEVNVDITGKRLSIRGEVEASKPFGIASYQTTAAIRKIQIRELTPDEIKDKGGDDDGDKK